MNEPRRLLSDPSAFDGLGDPTLARSLLRAGSDVAPPPDAKAQIWGRLEGAIGAAALGAGAAASTAPSTTGLEATAPSQATTIGTTTKVGSGALATKVGVLGIVAGTALFLTTLARRPEPELSANPPMDATAEVANDLTVVSLPTAVQTALSERDAPAEREVVAEKTKPITPVSGTEQTDKAQEKMNALLREADGVKRARSLLGGGDAAGALAELGAIDRDVEKGTMGQERHVLKIEALAASGQRDRAAQLAKAFIDANPASPYAKRLAPYASP